MRSFSGNVNQFEAFLSVTNYFYDFIVLSETWNTSKVAHKRSIQLSI